jgi:UDP-glucose 4-epimerase
LNILVTGSAGFIGSHVARRLVLMGHNVICLDDLSGGFLENIPKGATFIKGSVCDVDLVQHLFKNYKIDYVYHLAAYAAEGLSHFIRRFNYENNLIGSINLINESIKHDIKGFVFTSSIAVYGNQTPPFDEEMIPQPIDPYGISKLAVEQDLKAAHDLFGLNYIIFRPHNVYGENQNIFDPYRNVIGIFCKQILQNKPMTIFGDGNQKRAFSYIDDVAIPIAESINIEKAYNQIFNLGADQPYTINELVNEVSNAFGVKPNISYLPERSEAVFAYSNHDKVNSVFEIKNSTSLKDGISKTINWVKTVEMKESKVFTNIEITKNLPGSWISK